ncbi:hypothetical protein BHM03_00043770 [Ensete ventricosum]|nr:hypothetical protein BHM03_00043770 [Ensete ventricosum]
MIRSKLEAPLWCTTQQEEGLWIQGVNAMVLQRRVFVCVSELALDESLSHRHIGAIYHRGRSPRAARSSTSVNNAMTRRAVDSRGECHGTAEAGVPCMIGAVGELDYFSAHISLREPDKLEDKANLVELSYPKAKHRLERRWTRRSTTIPQRQIYRSQRKGCRCKATDSRAMGLATPWYRRGGTFVESSIPCSHGGRALVVKGAEEVENAKANSKYQDRAEGQRPRNFIRPMSKGFSSR